MQSRFFFLVGPLRTGSSLLARCIDDHPSAICLCESEINRALFRDYFVHLHGSRMIAHGLTLDEVIALLNCKKQDDIDSLLRWYDEVMTRVMQIFNKPEIQRFGDKSPDFFQSPELVHHLWNNYPLIYTVRDPRAVLGSIESQLDESPQDRADRWDRLMGNYLAWRPYLGTANLLVVRYEDLISSPESTMRQVYAHLGLPYSPRFLEPFPRIFANRFLWSTTVDMDTGIARSFDTSRVSAWREDLTYEQYRSVYKDKRITEFMDRFGYRDWP